MNNNINNSDQLNNLGITRLSLALRYLGIVIVIVSASCFLIQSWSNLTSNLKYFGFLGLTILLAATGAFCGLKIKDHKGARALLGLLLGIVTVHFSQLSALIFSQVNYQNLLIPKIFILEAASSLEVLFCVLLGLSVIIPLTYFAESIFVRAEAKMLTVGYLLINSFILLPTRATSLIAVIIIMMAITVSILILKYFRNSNFTSLEARFVRSLLWLPILIVAARQITLYATGLSFYGSILISIGIVMFYILPRTYQNSVDSFESLGMLAAIIGSICLSADFICYQRYFLNSAQALWIYALPLIMIFILADRFSLIKKTYYHNIAIFILGLVGLINTLLVASLMNAVIAIVIAVVIITYGFTYLSRGLFYLGLFELIIGITRCAIYAIQHSNIAPWVSMFILGLLSVVLAALVERNSVQLKNKLAFLAKK